MRSGFICARITPTAAPAVEPTGSRLIPSFLRRPKTFTPVRHPDDDGSWRYPLQEAVFAQTAEDRARLTDWTAPSRAWRRLVTWR